MKCVVILMKKIFLCLLCITFLYKGLSSEILYPWKDVYIGALDAKAWCGLVLAPYKDSIFAFRIRAKRDKEIADGIDLFYLISEVGPHAPDGQYSRIKMDLSLPFKKGKETPILKKPSQESDTLTFEWSRQDEKTVIGKISAPKYIEVQLIQYFPWEFDGVYKLLSDGHIKGESGVSKKFQYLLWTSKKGELVSRTSENELCILFPMEKKNVVYFVAGVDEDERILKNHIYRYKNEKTIERILLEEEERYQKKRVKIKGFHEGAPNAITNNLFWMTLYQPGYHRFYTPAGRRWIFPKPDGNTDHWTIFEWDSFFNALEVSLESTRHAKDVLKAVLETQYPNGNIPNWRGRFGGTTDRSQPPVGAYVTLKLFQKIGDIEILEHAYPYLKKWHSFWKAKKANGQVRRDGNGDGLLEWGSDKELLTKNVPPWEKDVPGKTRAMWESGQDDLPNWDDASFDDSTGTLTMNCLDLNSLYALDAWCLAQISKSIDKLEDYYFYLNEYNTIKELVNSLLWNEKEGFYFDRHWDGRFSKRKAASNFYPLLAGIPDSKRATRIVKHLLNPKEFWGDYVIPTISRDDPAFKDQQYWRGTIWPPTNYLVYQGLKAYGFDAVAYEFAEKSSSLFLRTWKNYQLCPENFDSRTGEAGGQRYQSWGPLFALIAIEDYLDFTPLEGFRFGMLKPEKKGRLSRASIQGRHYDLKISPSEIKLTEEGRDIIKADGGAVFRQFLYSENEVSFEIKTLSKRDVKIYFLTKGKYQLRIDDQIKKVFDGKSLKVKIPEGEHTILVWLLEKEK